MALGIDPPKGVLLYGPPGTGKTLLARAVANRTDACFIRVIGSELVQTYLGDGARMVRELFQMDRSKKACVPDPPRAAPRRVSRIFIPSHGPPMRTQVHHFLRRG